MGYAPSYSILVQTHLLSLVENRSSYQMPKHIRFYHSPILFITNARVHPGQQQVGQKVADQQEHG